jgi:hypothetical protein
MQEEKNRGRDEGCVLLEVKSIPDLSNICLSMQFFPKSTFTECLL